ncbi:MAG: ABC transporter ATP-binding protein [Desulfobacteraceae bacterium]|nr:ABC transporter ATP-binding protein [Desulfobacteraceae bacterium]
MLQVKSLTKNFDGFMAVNGAGLSLEKGQVIAVIGPNGAGKTTLFNLITGQLAPTSGTIRFKGEDITGIPPYAIVRKGLCRSYQVVNIFNRLTVFENVQVAVLSRRKHTFNLFSNARRMAVNETSRILESVGLKDMAHSISGSLSHGDQKVLEIAISLGNRPELLIMDEPTAGMSPEETEVTLSLMKKLSDEMGLTILFCEHDMNMVFAIAHEIMVMQQGKSIIQGKPDAVRVDKQVQEAYLGGDDICYA